MNKLIVLKVLLLVSIISNEAMAAKFFMVAYGSCKVQSEEAGKAVMGPYSSENLCKSGLTIGDNVRDRSGRCDKHGMIITSFTCKIYASLKAAEEAENLPIDDF